MTGIEYLIGAFGIVVTMIVAAAIFSYFEIERHAEEHEEDGDARRAVPSRRPANQRRAQ